MVGEAHTGLNTVGRVARLDEHAWGRVISGRPDASLTIVRPRFGVEQLLCPFPLTGSAYSCGICTGRRAPGGLVSSLQTCESAAPTGIETTMTILGHFSVSSTDRPSWLVRFKEKGCAKRPSQVRVS